MTKNKNLAMLQCQFKDNFIIKMHTKVLMQRCGCLTGEIGDRVQFFKEATKVPTLEQIVFVNRGERERINYEWGTGKEFLRG